MRMFNPLHQVFHSSVAMWFSQKQNGTKHRISQVHRNNSQSESYTSLSEKIQKVTRKISRGFYSDKIDAINKDFFTVCSTIVECPSCDQIFKTTKECYIHMFLSTRLFCRKIISNIKENGHTEDVNRMGIQKVIMKCCYQKIQL